MANKIYLARETPLSFRTGGDVSFSIASLANGSGWCSARVDLGAASTAYKFEWRACFQLVSSPSVLDGSQSIDVFLVTSNGTFADGGMASTEAAISSDDKRFNLEPIGNVIADSAGVTFYGSGRFELGSRYFSIAIFNFTGSALSVTQSSTINNLIVTPLVEEIQ